MAALANVIAAAQQIGSNATQLSTGTSATAQSLSQKADELQSVTAPHKRARAPPSKFAPPAKLSRAAPPP